MRRRRRRLRAARGTASAFERRCGERRSPPRLRFAFALISVIQNFSLRSDLHEAQNRVVALQTQMAGRTNAHRARRPHALGFDRDRREALLTVAYGTVVTTRARTCTSRCRRFRPCSAARVYQAWTLAKGAKTVSLRASRSHRTSNGLTLVPLPEDAGKLGAVALTVEPEGGSRQLDHQAGIRSTADVTPTARNRYARNNRRDALAFTSRRAPSKTHSCTGFSKAGTAHTRPTTIMLDRKRDGVRRRGDLLWRTARPRRRRATRPSTHSPCRRDNYPGMRSFVGPKYRRSTDCGRAYKGPGIALRRSCAACQPLYMP